MTGRELYVAFAPDQIEDLPRWGVLLGAVVPLDGAWRATGTLLRVSPQEADALCETVEAAAEVVANDTDGDPLRMIKARVRVRDAASVATRLADHPDFDADPDDGARLSWLGQEVPAEQRAAMLAEARAHLRAQGHSDADIADMGEPQRWVRGQIQRRGDGLTVEVNSEQRLHGLLTILDQLDARPTVIDRSHVDPTQDLPWPAGQRPWRGGLAPADEGWERQWLDEPLPVLRNRTPRHVAATDDWPVVESLLRQLEHDADLLAHEGEPGADTAWLRDQLKLSISRFL